jgi:hypothetical protein
LIVVSNYLLFLQSYVGDMSVKLAMLLNVADTSLEANMPEMQRQLNQLHTEVKTGTQTVCEKVDGLSEQLKESMESRPTRTELAADFAQIAVRLAGGGGRATTRRTTTTETERTTTDEQDGIDDDLERASEHVLVARDIDCVDEIYREFKGLQRFTDVPIAGGLEECDRRWKTKWRRHFNPADQKRFSRMSMLSKAIDNQVKEGRVLSEVLGSFDHYFLQKKRSFGGLIALLQEEGLLQKKAPRTKRAVRGESPGEGGGGG